MKSARAHRWAAGALALALAGATGSGACRRDPPAEERGVSVSGGGPKPVRALGDLGREVGLVFPAGARLIGVERENGMDDLLALEVEIKSSELAAFLERSPVKAADLQPGEGGLLGADHDWWAPGRAVNLRTGQARLPGARVLNLGVADGHRPGTTVLYVVNHGT
jgi:hypothetical protein